MKKNLFGMVLHQINGTIEIIGLKQMVLRLPAWMYWRTI